MTMTKVVKGDKATNRFHNLRVEEVSLVDAAANEEDFLVIKRRNEMSGKTTEAAGKEQATATNPATDAPASVAKTEGATTPVVASPEPPAAAPAATTPSIAEQVTAGVTSGMQAFFASQQPQTVAQAVPAAPTPAAPAPAPTATAPVAKSEGSQILEALAGINKRLDEQDAKIEKATTVRAAAKGASVPDSTKVAKDDGEKTKSKWAGTAVHAVTQRGR